MAKSVDDVVPDRPTWNGDLAELEAAQQPGLTGAVAEAAASGLAELTRLDAIVAEAESRLLDAWLEISSPGSVLSKDDDGFYVILETVVADLRDRLEDSRRVASTFNIAFFGRTGAGKSTLLSALGRLDGQLVSDGRSDFTTDVQPLDWHGCRLFDTPGINGWGRTRPRRDLEEAAREAVEVADIVLLCFDSQSQQASEFTKVAAWVRAYRKPVIAVLNVRNTMWRHPARVAAAAQRQGLSRTAQQHADNITSELEAIGLQDVPVVAIHSKRSLFARASTPFFGPAATELEAERSTYGLAYLDRMSNLPVLERLISACVVEGAADLRLAALREGLQAALLAWADEIEFLANQQQRRGKTIEGVVAEGLNILGYPDPKRRRALLPHDDGADLVERLEAARGEPFTAPSSGRLESHVRHLLRSHLYQHRDHSHGAADELILDAFDRRRQVSKDEFESKVFDVEEVAKSIAAVGNLAADFLVENLDIVRIDARIDLDLIDRSPTAIRGNTGLGRRRAADALKAGGLLSSGTGAALGVVLLTNFWNPAGWTAAAILGGLGIASAVLGFFGKRSRRSSEERRVETRARALADARTSVNTFFDECEAQQLAKIMDDAWASARKSLAGQLAEALHVRAGCHRLAADAVWLREQAASQPPVPSPADIILCASGRVLADASSSLPVRALLLGEDWLDDSSHGDPSEQLSEADREFLAAVEQENRHSFASYLASTYREFVEPVESWLDSLASSAYLDETAQTEVRRARALLGQPPRVVLLGDYSSGKTSLIKRLLAEAGVETPRNMQVDARAATSTPSRYAFGRLELVDSPGFQSGHDEHDAAALEASDVSAMTVVVLHVNLLIGDTSRLDRLLLGDETSVGKGRRTIFVVGRIDEIGVDPIASPREFVVRRRQKVDELLSILESKGMGIARDQVLTLAADPYGLVADKPAVTAADYAAGNRIWDGAGAMSAPLLSADDQTLSGMAAVTAIDLGRSALLAAQHRTKLEIDDLEGAQAAGERFEQLMETSLAELRLLEQSVERRVRGAIDDHANEVLAEALGAGPDEVETMSKRLQFWWQDPRLGSAIAALEPEIRRNLTDWSRRHASEFEREVRRMMFTVEADEYDAMGKDAKNSVKDGVRVAGEITKHTATMVKAAGTRDAVYAIVKSFGGKFKPWGAVKLGTKVAKVGAVLGVIAVGFDIVEWVVAAKKEDNRESARLEAVRHVRATREIVAKDLLSQPDSPIEALQELGAGITESLGRLQIAADERRRSAQEASQRLDSVSTLLDAGDTLSHRATTEVTT
ncbi:hypothetical protein HP550_14530 [Cellulomonas humilata]|uniref:AAA+ ATPase domain-containing protein n=1 Tax=Cellulomonas humilata TaxID=144055 RepID=A0A7Y6A2L7_9CELL|nr:hypothetical protein [Cellulomonas humilata]